MDTCGDPIFVLDPTVLFTFDLVSGLFLLQRLTRRLESGTGGMQPEDQDLRHLPTWDT